MIILFDHGTPRGLMRALRKHKVITAYEKGWDRLHNGELLPRAEEEGVDLLVTTDRRIRYQQNLKDRKIGIVAPTGSTRWSRVRLHADRIAAAVEATRAGAYAEVNIPFNPAT